MRWRDRRPDRGAGDRQGGRGACHERGVWLKSGVWSLQIASDLLQLFIKVLLAVSQGWT